MDYKRILIQLFCFIHILHLISAQNLDIRRIGGGNFANVNLFANSEYSLMGVSKFPYSDEKIIYDIGGNLFNKYSIDENSLTINKDVNATFNYTHRNFSGVSFYYDSCWISISGNNKLEIYNFTTKEYANSDLEYFFGVKDIAEYGNVVPFYDEYSYEYISYVFPFIIQNQTTTEFVLFMVNVDNLPFFYKWDYLYEKQCKKTKVISCFSTFSPSRLICLFINTQNKLTIEIYNSTLGVEKQYSLAQTTNNVEDMFFKAISLEEGNNGIFAYYTKNDDEYLRIDVKKLEYVYNNNSKDISLQNYGDYGTLSIDAKNFNKHYMLNDIVETNTGDVYFASTSLDKEILYIVKIKLNATIISKQVITIKMFEENNIKFYKDLKLINYDKSFALGFSHCTQKKCEEKTYHFSSLIFFSELEYIPDYNYDIIKNIYDSNYQSNDSLLVDLNIYKNKIIGYKFKSIIFSEIPEDISLYNPKNHSEVYSYESFDFSTFEIKVSLNQIGNITLQYMLEFEESYSTTRRNLRRLDIQSRLVSFTLQLSEVISNQCSDELCSLCSSSDTNNCLSCKYDYSFVGNKKFCFSEEGDMDTNQIDEIYNGIAGDIENQNFMTIKQGNAVIQFVPVDVQMNNDLNFVSSIDLGECGKLLKEQEGLDEDEEFLMVKIDLVRTDISATYVQYDIYNPHTLEKVDTNVCEGTTIKIHTPVSLSESKLSFLSSIEDSGYNALDIKDSFYNDVCTPYTAENGADMVLSSRKSIIYDSNKNIYFCQKGCELEKFNAKNSKAECNCDIQTGNSETDITKLSFDKTKFADSFYKTLFNSNFRVLKCLKLVFSLKGLKTNYGSYLMSALFGFFIVFIVFHIITGQKNIVDILNIALKSKGIEFPKEKVNEKIQEKIKDKPKENKKEENKADDDKKKRRKSKSSKKHRRDSKNIKIDQVQVAPKRRHSKGHNKRKSVSKEVIDKNHEGIVVNTNNNMIEKPTEIKDKDKKDKKHHHHHRHSKSHNYIPKFTPEEENRLIEQAKGLNDNEINSLDYDMAVIIDKRTYCQYYYSLLKKKQLILFAFLPTNDYNLIPMKILLFIVSFSLYFTINGFFFSDDTMNKIYEDNGAFNIIYQLPQIFYSSVISAVINIILKMLSLSESQILAIKKEKDLEKSKEMAKKTKRTLNIKLIIFIILSTIFMLFFWYFISCFCAVYKNTQATLIEDTLLSFFLSMLYPFGLNLFPGLFRIPALRAPNRDKKYKYKISNYIALI